MISLLKYFNRIGFILLWVLISLAISATDSLAIEKDSAAEVSSGYALIAGGSKGIGYGLAQALAKRHYDLILVARHRDSLEAAKSKLESQFNVHVELLQYDLSTDSAAFRIAEWCMQHQVRLKVLCNVAGFGGEKDYMELPVESLRYMVRLNVESAIVLTQTLLPLLESNAPSYILNVASMAGLAPIPEKNMYAATKSAVVYFSYSLRYQLKEKDISVSVLCPGPVYTKPEIIETTRKNLGWFGDQMALTPERTGEVAIRKTLNKHLLIVPGTLAKTSSILIRLLPMRWVTAIYAGLGK